MGKVKYNEEMKLQTVKYVLEGGKSATKVAKELGIDTNTVCRWEWKIRRIMRENGFYPQTRKKWKPYRKAKSDGMYSENKVIRHFLPDRFNELWAGDITYIPTNMGWVYLAPFRVSDRIRPWI